MQINAIRNSQPNYNQSFGAINYAGAKETLLKVLTTDELKEFKQFVEVHEKNTLSGITLFGHGKKLEANVYNSLRGNDGICKNCSQRFLESPFGFIKRMVRAADILANKAQDIVERQNILG